MVRKLAVYAAVLLAAPSGLFSQDTEAQREARFQSLWTQADQVHSEDRFEDAETNYRNILLEFPNSQRTALRLAIVQERQGKTDDALQAFDRAIDMDPEGYWAEVGLFFKARACYKGKRPQDARLAIQKLRQFYPDSPYNARALVLEATHEDGDLQAAQEHLDKELAAAEALEEAIATGAMGDDDQALAMIEEILPASQTATRYRALSTKGNILFRNGRYEESLAAFQGILNDLEVTNPDASAVREAKTRVAALSHALDDRDTALNSYLELLDSGADDAITGNAALQSMGLIFEDLQHGKMRGESFSSKQWDSIQEMGDLVLTLDGATTGQKARARLMRLEGLCWQQRYEEALVEFDLYLEDFGDNEQLRQETATAHFFISEGLQKLERYEDALIHFNKVIELYPTEDYIWPRMDHLPRTYFRIWETLKKLDSDIVILRSAADDLYSRFPKSSYAEHVRGDMIVLEGRNHD